jgi:hypothetical protein
MATVVTMTVVALGGGVAAGWANTAEPATHPVAAPAPAAITTSFVQVIEAPRFLPMARAHETAPVAPPVVKSTAPVVVAHPTHPAFTHTTSTAAAVANALATRNLTPAADNLGAPASCSAAISYLEANSAPGFHFECPGYALGHQAMTCVNVAGVCPGERLIVISTVCQASYMNEAHNSWIVAGYRSGQIDPYGYCE